MKYGDAVQYVRNGQSLNALVVAARGDVLDVVYPDPAIGPQLYRTHGLLSTAFSVPKMSPQNVTQCWHEVDAEILREARHGAADLDAVIAEQQLPDDTQFFRP